MGDSAESAADWKGHYICFFVFEKPNTTIYCARLCLLQFNPIPFNTPQHAKTFNSE